ncbi:MAG: DNA gyrase subunit A [Clostridia bacterium]|nr:DNA gyrase subunit A [Clostridia bacterium]
MKKSYIDYAMSVIVGRALPDVRDGLKPVHRRILYAMYEDNLTSDKPFKKSATCVGDVLGRYHPHGDASVYDALVRLAQDFSLRYCLVEGHGNFGSVDGDPAAAYRYTEARLSKISNEMLRDIDKETVDWDPNFDESRKEPRVLPSRFPNLLVNGSSGIAVGMATNIPPHNLREVINACILVLDNPEATLDDLLTCVPGPDFPTKGIIMGRSGIRQAYETGRGRVVVRARTHFEEYGKEKRTRIIVTELPYQVNKRQLIKNIADQVKEKRLEDISDLREESDRNGMRIVIELKKDANAQVVLNKLFTQTELQSSFSINMLALVENQTQPKILSLRHILDEYLAFQKDIITRRTKFDLRKAREREHLLQGLLIAQDNIDEVIAIIRSSYDNAKDRLMERFGLDDVQSQAILDMRLKALQGLDREKLQAEFDALEEKIKWFISLLEDENLMKEELKKELSEIADKFGDDRKTEIAEVEEEIDLEDLIERHTCVITMTHTGYIKRQRADTYTAQNRGGKGIVGMTTKEDDYVEKVLVANSHSFILFFTNRGKVYMKKAYRIPEASRTAKGTNLVNILELEKDEKVTAILSVLGFAEGEYLTMVTRKGVIKRTKLTEFSYQRKGGKIAIRLDEGDSLLFVRHTKGEESLILASKGGMAVRFDENNVRCMGRTARGVRGMTLGEGDEIIGVALVDQEKTLLTVSEFGLGKRSAFDEFREMKNRGGKGVTAQKLTEKSGNLAAIATVSEDDDIMLITNDGTIIRTPVSGINVYSRAAAGVIVMRLDEGCSIINMARVEKEEEIEEEAEAVEEEAKNTVILSENDAENAPEVSEAAAEEPADEEPAGEESSEEAKDEE